MQISTYIVANRISVYLFDSPQHNLPYWYDDMFIKVISRVYLISEMAVFA